MKYNTSIVLAYFQEVGLPKPELEYKFNPERKWRFDFSWPTKIDGPYMLACKVALEVQGGIWVQGGHNRGAGLRKEHEKRNAAACLGWRIIYVEPKDLCTTETVELIKRCLRIY